MNVQPDTGARSIITRLHDLVVAAKAWRRAHRLHWPSESVDKPTTGPTISRSDYLAAERRLIDAIGALDHGAQSVCPPDGLGLVVERTEGAHG